MTPERVRALPVGTHVRIGSATSGVCGKAAVVTGPGEDGHDVTCRLVTSGHVLGFYAREIASQLVGNELKDLLDLERPKPDQRRVAAVGRFV